MKESSAQADFHAVDYLSTPCQFCARFCTSDCSKSGLVGGLQARAPGQKKVVSNKIRPPFCNKLPADSAVLHALHQGVVYIGYNYTTTCITH